MRVYFVPFLLFAAISGPALGQPTRIAVAPLQFTAPAKFAGPDRESTAAIVERVAYDWLFRAIDASDFLPARPSQLQAALQDNKLDFSKREQRTMEKLQAFGKSAEADFAILILVEGTEQRNPRPIAAAANPNLNKSDNIVKVRFWLQDIRQNLLLIDGAKKTFEANAKGPYFGTVNARDLYGDPQSKAIVIQNEYRKRAEWLGRALILAMKGAIQAPIGLKDPSA
jgi:hypothetical protein